MKKETKFVKLFEDFKVEKQKKQEKAHREKVKQINEGILQDSWEKIKSTVTNTKDAFQEFLSKHLDNAIDYFHVLLSGKIIEKGPKKGTPAVKYYSQDDGPITQQLTNFYSDTEFVKLNPLDSTDLENMKPENREKNDVERIVDEIINNDYVPQPKINEAMAQDRVSLQSTQHRNVSSAVVSSYIKRLYHHQSKKGRHAARAMKPLLVLGAPGIGKTMIASQVADELGLDMLTPDVSILDKQDLLGLPVHYQTKEGEVDKEGNVISAPQGITYQAPTDLLPFHKKSPRGGILFLDEFTNAEEYMMSTLNQLIQSGRVNDYYMPDNWIIVAAGNRPEDSDAVLDLSGFGTLAERFRIVNFVPKLEDWLAYGEKTNKEYKAWKEKYEKGELDPKKVPMPEYIYPEFLEFVNHYPEYFYNKPKGTTEGYAGPRNWATLTTNLEEIIEMENIDDWKDLPQDVLYDELIANVGREAADDFNDYISIFKKLSPKDLDQVAKDPMKAPMIEGLNTNFAKFYGLMDYLLSQGTKEEDVVQRFKNIHNIIKYLGRYENNQALTAGVNRLQKEYREFSPYGNTDSLPKKAQDLLKNIVKMSNELMAQNYDKQAAKATEGFKQRKEENKNKKEGK